MPAIQELIEQLELFSSELIDLKEPIDQEKILEFEKKLNFNLPNDYKTFLKKHNGLTLIGLTIYGIDNSMGANSLEKSYLFEHFEVDNPMPEYLVPFSPDGAGNHYCFDLRACNNESCKIIFWQHDFIYS